MDTAEIFVVVGALSLIALTLWFFFGAPKSPQNKGEILNETLKDEPPNNDKSSTRSANTPIIYACPMHAWITSEDAAAVCSICGMKLLRRD